MQTITIGNTFGYPWCLGPYRSYKPSLLNKTCDCPAEVGKSGIGIWPRVISLCVGVLNGKGLCGLVSPKQKQKTETPSWNCCPANPPRNLLFCSWLVWGRGQLLLVVLMATETSLPPAARQFARWWTEAFAKNSNDPWPGTNGKRIRICRLWLVRRPNLPS